MDGLSGQLEGAQGCRKEEGAEKEEAEEESGPR